ncbi:MAG: ribosomal RNA small subunit methyltransferase A [Candidatus Moranbacteria bacterium]|jgi:16S rRNA (adenine1518-N6/adenine1519-N6)-dimethyltransferase|nr:ribosomal RNA small subunit methyltransferase A [Candidatus Moranbacteria bacterium]MBP9801265.1 ribosomal RNA small subunit methyltransferase A [Candidatus Moranbacteria bacterium]
MDIKAKKSLGQNFLRDQSIIDRILSVADVQKSDRIFEIGPGTGILTQALSQTGATVLAIEIDAQLVERLNKIFVQSQNISILEGSVLDINLEELLAHSGYEYQQYKVVANIPYYITAPIIRTLLSLQSQASSITLMVQNEVADRLVAQPGSMSLLSVMAQYYAEVEKCFFVPRTAFDPVPAVDSAVLKLIPKHRFQASEDRHVFRVVRAGFSARRKTLANNLANTFHLERARIGQLFTALGIQPMIRAQELSVSEWRALADLVAKEIDTPGEL